MKIPFFFCYLCVTCDKRVLLLVTSHDYLLESPPVIVNTLLRKSKFILGCYVDYRFIMSLHCRSQTPRSDLGQVAHVSPTPSVTSQKLDITCRTLEAACSSWLGCWSNNVANNLLSSFHSTAEYYAPVWCAVLSPTLWPCDQRHLAHCDWMPASHTSGQPSYTRMRPT